MFETVSKCRTTEVVSDFIPLGHKQRAKVYAASISNLLSMFITEMYVLQIGGCLIETDLSFPVHMEMKA